MAEEAFASLPIKEARISNARGCLEVLVAELQGGVAPFGSLQIRRTWAFDMFEGLELVAKVEPLNCSS